MKNRLIRLGVGASLVVVASAPMTAPAHAWTCLGEVGYAMCFVVNTACVPVELVAGKVLGNDEICQFG